MTHFGQENSPPFMLMVMSRLVLLLFLAISMGCSRSVESCRRDADGLVAALARELAMVNSAGDIKKKMTRIRRLYLELAEVMIALDSAYDRDASQLREPSEASEQLRLQLLRLYAIPGGRELLEEAQAEAVHQLERRLGPPALLG